MSSRPPRRRPAPSVGRPAVGPKRSTRRSRRRSRTIGQTKAAAQQRLRRFRQSTLLAVGITGLLILLFSPASSREQPLQGAVPLQGARLPDTISIVQQIPTAELQLAPDSAIPSDSARRAAAREATGTLRNLWLGFLGNLPKYGIALGILLIAAVLTRLVRAVLRRVFGQWSRADAVTAMVGIAIWLLALGVAMSVLLGDIRALVGSVGLVGLALSWALQTPIESFTGWILNSFHGFYRVGDRIAVGDVFGDVYQIDFLTTTVWEYGGVDRPPGSIRAEQPTGRLITFPNAEIVSGTIINYTRDFPYVWDELEVGVANESDLTLAMEVLRGIANEVLGDQMREPARQYEALLRREDLDRDVADHPEVYAAINDWATNLTIRYLVGAREKRRWKSALVVRVAQELGKAEYSERIIAVYPRRQVQFVGADGRPTPPDPQ